MAESLRFSDAVVVMGVASCGKTMVGEALAQHLGVTFTEGDNLHSAENVAKMSAGIPLTDDDRWPWLTRVGASLRGNEGHIVSCSALKRAYRSVIVSAAKRPMKFVHLHGSRELLQDRIAARTGHFMPPSLLDSQLATLEMPGPDENCVTIDIGKPAESIVAEALNFLLKKGN